MHKYTYMRVKWQDSKESKNAIKHILKFIYQQKLIIHNNIKELILVTELWHYVWSKLYKFD